MPDHRAKSGEPGSLTNSGTALCEPIHTPASGFAQMPWLRRLPRQGPPGRHHMDVPGAVPLAEILRRFGGQ